MFPISFNYTSNDNLLNSKVIPSSKYLLIHSSMGVEPFVEPWPLFQSLNPIHSR
jgi:hypothetical protein